MALMEVILGIALIHLLACLSPGPDIFLVVLNSLRHGRGTGIATTAGVLTGVTVHITLGLTGISYLLAHQPGTRAGLTLGGSAWLLYLGARGLRSLRQPTDGDYPHPASRVALPPAKAWVQGLFVNLLNVKALLFFLSLFSIALGPDQPFLLRIGAGVTMILVQAVAFSTVACLIDRPALQSRWPGIQRILETAISLLLIAVGLWMGAVTVLGF